MKVIFLGTSGSMPTDSRGSSAIAIKQGREVVLLDCGEGTQRQMVRAHLSFHKVSHILITHLHGDHILGLPGLLQTMTLLQREEPLDIFGPKGTFSYIQTVSDALGGPGFVVSIHEIESPGTIYEGSDYAIEAIHAQHRVECWSFLISEHPRPGRFHPEKAKELCVPEGRLWKRLQDGFDVEVDGKIIHSSDVVDTSRAGRRVVYSGDTTPTEQLVAVSKGVDLLIHEATFTEELLQRAAEDGHSTARQAAEQAKNAGVIKLILTHLSSRYFDPEQILVEAKAIFPNVLVAEDLLVYEIPPHH